MTIFVGLGFFSHDSQVWVVGTEALYLVEEVDQGAVQRLVAAVIRQIHQYSIRETEQVTIAATCHEPCWPLEVAMIHLSSRLVGLRNVVLIPTRLWHIFDCEDLSMKCHLSWRKLLLKKLVSAIHLFSFPLAREAFLQKCLRGGRIVDQNCHLHRRVLLNLLLQVMEMHQVAYSHDCCSCQTSHYLSQKRGNSFLEIA